MAIKLVFRNGFSYDFKAASNEAAIDEFDESKTDQSMREEADINTLIKRFAVGQPKAFTGKVPVYGDFTGVGDFREAMHAVMEAEASFMQMPAELRARLDNDPQRFLEFCNDPANLDEMKKYGLVTVEDNSVVVPPPPA